jgi:Ran GTPase-activating protein (RanGAP) involved in mRNA processing and transport
VCGAQDEINEVDQGPIKALANDVPGVAEYVRGTLARYKADKMFKAAGKRCLELQDFLSKEMPPEIHHKMLPASRTVALRQTSKMMRTAVEKADAVVQARRGVQFPDGQGLLDKLNGLNAWCKVTVLRLTSCGLGEGGGRALAETLRLNTAVTELDLHDNGLGESGGLMLAETLRLNTTLTELHLQDNVLGEGGGRALAETLRLNTTVTSLNLGGNGLGEGGGRALAETLRVNTTLASLNLDYNDLGEGGGRSLAETLRLNTTLTQLHLCDNGLGEGGVRSLAETLRLNTTLTELHLQENDLGVEQESALRQAWGDRRGSFQGLGLGAYLKLTAEEAATLRRTYTIAEFKVLHSSSMGFCDVREYIDTSEEQEQMERLHRVAFRRALLDVQGNTHGVVDDAEHTLATVRPMFSRVDEELLFDDLPGAGAGRSSKNIC